MKKLRVGWFTFTCSEDSAIVFLELMNERHAEWMQKIEFAHMKLLSSRSETKNIDVAFVEGGISGKKEEDALRKIRKGSKKVVAIGACAVTGLPSGQRNSFSKEQMEKIKPFLKLHNLREKVEPVAKYVKIDEQVPGCPMEERAFLALLDKYFKEFGVE